MAYEAVAFSPIPCGLNVPNLLSIVFIHAFIQSSVLITCHKMLLILACSFLLNCTMVLLAILQLRSFFIIYFSNYHYDYFFPVCNGIISLVSMSRKWD